MEDNLGLRTLNKNPLKAALLLVSVVGNAESVFFKIAIGSCLLHTLLMHRGRQHPHPSQG